MEAWSDSKKKKTTSRRKSENVDTLEVKSQQTKSDVLHSLVPIFYVSKICGLLPVKFMQSNKRHVDTSQVAYGVILALALSAVQCWGLYRDLRNGWQNSTRLFSKTAITVTGSDVFFVISVTAFAILGSSSRWQYLQQALDKILEADEKLYFIESSKNIRKMSIILISCTFVYLISISILDYISWNILAAAKDNSKLYNDKGPINYSPLYLMYTVIVALQMQYAIVLMSLGERFSKLNNTIVNVTKANVIIDYFRKDMGLAAQESRREISRSFVTSPDLSRRTHRQRHFKRTSGSIEDAIYGENYASGVIDQLIIVHDILCDSIIHINKAYGVTLLMCTLSCLIHLVITLYFLYAEINSPNSRWYVFIRQIGWIIFHIYKMLLFVQPPYMVTTKARNTGSLVSQALSNTWNPQAQKQLERFTMQLLHRPVEFTACGMFYLDRGLMTSIAGAVTTYLVILVQFQDNEDNATRELLQNASDLLRNVSGITRV